MPDERRGEIRPTDQSEDSGVRASEYIEKAADSVRPSPPPPPPPQPNPGDEPIGGIDPDGPVNQVRGGVYIEKSQDSAPEERSDSSTDERPDSE